jgi:ribosomal 30S subunit maturation factor RimM
MLVVAGHLVPMVRAIVCEIDLGRRCIVIDPPAGLLD